MAGYVAAAVNAPDLEPVGAVAGVSDGGVRRAGPSRHADGQEPLVVIPPDLIPFRPDGANALVRLIVPVAGDQLCCRIGASDRLLDKIELVIIAEQADLDAARQRCAILVLDVALDPLQQVVSIVKGTGLVGEGRGADRSNDLIEGVHVYARSESAVSDTRPTGMNDGCWDSNLIDLVAGCHRKAIGVYRLPFQVSFFDAVSDTEILKRCNNAFWIDASYKPPLSIVFGVLLNDIGESCPVRSMRVRVNNTS